MRAVDGARTCRSIAVMQGRGNDNARGNYTGGG
jgi:hypothetical protein